jgi:hypothetical protein
MPAKKKFSLVKELKKLTKGKQSSRRERAKLKSLLSGGEEVGGQRPSCWPMKSYAMGFHPSQVKKANELHAKAKTGCYHDKTGRLVIPDNGARKRALKLYGMTDLSGFN